MNAIPQPKGIEFSKTGWHGVKIIQKYKRKKKIFQVVL